MLQQSPNQYARRWPSFFLAVLIEHLSPTPRYDISLRRNRASNIRGPAVPPRVDRWPMPRLVTAEPSCARCRECAWSAMRTTIGGIDHTIQCTIYRSWDVGFTSDFHPTTELCQTLPHFAFVPMADSASVEVGLGRNGRLQFHGNFGAATGLTQMACHQT